MKSEAGTLTKSVAAVCSVLLGLFAVAAVAYKLVHRGEAVHALRTVPMFSEMGTLPLTVGIGLVVGLEAVVGVCLLSRRNQRAAAIALFAMLAAFSWVVAPHVHPARCGCTWSWMPMAPESPAALLLRNGVLATMCIAVVAGSQSGRRMGAR